MATPFRSISKPTPSSTGGQEARPTSTPGFTGAALDGPSRALRHLVVVGKALPAARTITPRGIESIIGPNDDRQRILETDLSPWRAICALNMRGALGSGVIGTGWFAGPQTVITAGHCVYSRVFFGEAGWAEEIEVAPGRNGADMPFGQESSTRFAALEGWVQGEDPDYDIGCIHLNEPLGEKVGWFSIAALPAEALVGSAVNVSGYPADRGGGAQQWYDSSSIRGVTDRRIFYGLDTFGGQSGAPAWVQDSTSTTDIRVVGIHAYGTAGGAPPGVTEPVNSAPRITPDVLDQIRAWVEEDGGWPPNGTETQTGEPVPHRESLLSDEDIRAIAELLAAALDNRRPAATAQV
jgi:V8-like Glu-specific endopeptidase